MFQDSDAGAQVPELLFEGSDARREV